MLYESLEDKSVKCNLCARRCLIRDGHLGFCRVRKNIDGKLYTLVYGKVVSAAVDPIEKKPLFHFHPGSSVMSIATIGCNFRCKFCDNWVISQEEEIYGKKLPPEKVVELALKYNCQGISYTYTEPTIFFEYAYDTAKMAKEKGLFNTFVTNGYMTPEAVEKIAPYLDAATVDFKGSANPEFYRKFSGVPKVEPIFESLLEMKRQGIFIEITNLIVPKYGDSMEDMKKLARWIVENLGPETPLHILQFHPDYQLIDIPSTPLESLEKARKIALEEGLHYVYIGNVPGHEGENTYCPKCGELLIERYAFTIITWKVTGDGKCPNCGFKINVVGKNLGRRSPQHVVL
ncbi:MAG: AmmeMemoRadiSam system radical SAM enzyme [archaeon GB-1867-005]|nr:AmmeMemoRadiSam system radical SAM enzyme [Candidatus Culexmicrobium cathedralense]